METLAGPIPGENFTSDTRNYPWHREPEYDDLDDALDYTFKRITSREVSLGMMTLAKNDVPLASIAQMYLMGGVGNGKWTPDYALLMAGPVTHVLSLMAKASKVKYRLGIEDAPIAYSDAFFEEMNSLSVKEEEAVGMMGDVMGMSLGEEGLEPPEMPTEPQGALPEPSGVPSTGLAGMAAQDPSMTQGMDQGMTGDPSVGMPETPDINV